MKATTWKFFALQTGSMTSGDLGPLNETAQAVRAMKEKYIQWQQRLDALIAQVQTLGTAWMSQKFMSDVCHLGAAHSAIIQYHGRAFYEMGFCLLDSC